MKILIISGGNSPERQISLISARAVKKALGKNGHSALTYDLKEGYQKLRRKIKEFDLVFPVLHGEEGEGGSLQEFLSKYDMPYVGGDHKGHKKGWYKIPFKKFCQKEGFLTPVWKSITNKKEIIDFGLPAVLKSSNGGSSREVAIIKYISDLENKNCRKILTSNNPLFIEKFLPGIEVTAGILIDKVLPVVEIRPPKGEWFDFQNKYSGKTEEISHAPSLKEETRLLVQSISLKIHNLLDLGPFSRIDFIVSEGKPYVLEVNTIPGLTPESLYLKAALAAGIDFNLMVEELLLKGIGVHKKGTP